MVKNKEPLNEEDEAILQKEKDRQAAYRRKNKKKRSEDPGEMWKLKCKLIDEEEKTALQGRKLQSKTCEIKRMKKENEKLQKMLDYTVTQDAVKKRIEEWKLLDLNRRGHTKNKPEGWHLLVHHYPEIRDAAPI